MLPEDEHELLDRIELLPDSIAKGRVLKITIYDFLQAEDIQGKGTENDRTGTSTGLLYALDDDAGIKKHRHTQDMETYVVIQKILKLPAELDEEQRELSPNICPIGSEHGIDKMQKGTLIGTFKVSEKYIGKLVPVKSGSEPEPLYNKGFGEER